MRALVRGVAASFAAQALSMQPRAVPICLDAARQQHGAYVALLRRLLGDDSVLQLPADDAFPDCCFCEDAAVVVGDTAVVATIGAGPRQGEEAAVADTLAALGYRLRRLTPPATLDGGDVLQLPGSRHILVGFSRRTNAAALEQLQAALQPQGAVLHGVEVQHGLHLKSAMTALDGRTLLYADDAAGRSLRAALERGSHPALLDGAAGGGGGAGSKAVQHVMVEPAAANVLLLPGHVIMPAGLPRSQAVLQALADERGLQLHRLDFAEFAKADGSLTCASILLPPAL